MISSARAQSRVVTTVTLLLSNHHDVVLCEMLYVVEWLTILKAEADGLKIYSKRCLCFDLFFIVRSLPFWSSFLC